MAARWESSEIEALLARTGADERTLTWSHLLKLAEVEDDLRRERLISTVLTKNLSVRELKSAIGQPAENAEGLPSEGQAATSRKAGTPGEVVPGSGACTAEAANGAGQPSAPNDAVAEQDSDDHGGPHAGPSPPKIAMPDPRTQSAIRIGLAELIAVGEEDVKHLRALTDNLVHLVLEMSPAACPSTCPRQLVAARRIMSAFAVLAVGSIPRFEACIAHCLIKHPDQDSDQNEHRASRKTA